MRVGGKYVCWWNRGMPLSDSKIRALVPGEKRYRVADAEGLGVVVNQFRRVAVFPLSVGSVFRQDGRANKATTALVFMGREWVSGPLRQQERGGIGSGPGAERTTDRPLI